MASINFAHKEIISKIVYYGPGVSGKTTNLQHVFKKIPSDTRGELISLATDADRTLYFDFLPVNVGSIQGFTTKFQLYTVPGQVYYNATRKLVLRGVDGVVFVADSQIEKMDENIESLQNLRDNLLEYGYNPDEIPMVIQYNKRDLPNAAPIEEMQKILNEKGHPYFESVASKGDGVFKTLKAISKLVLEEIRTKTMGAPNTVRSKPKPEFVPDGAGSTGGVQNSGGVAVAESPKVVAKPIIEAQPEIIAPAAQATTTEPEVLPLVEPPIVKTATEEPVAQPETVEPTAQAANAEPEVLPLVKQPVAETVTEEPVYKVNTAEPVVQAEPKSEARIVPDVQDKVSEPVQPSVQDEEKIEVEPEQPKSDKPGIMQDEETLTNVVVSDSQGLPEAEEEEPVKDDLEETTERSVLREENVADIDPVSPDVNTEVDLADEDIESTADNNVEDVSPPVENITEPEPIVAEQQVNEDKKPSLEDFDEESTDVRELSFNNTLPLRKPQMAESRKVKEKRRFGFLGLFRKKQVKE